MKKEILKQLRSDYESVEIKPSRDLWDRIDLELEKTSDLPLKRSFQWWKYAAVVLLLISFGGFFYFSSKQAGNNAITTKTDNSDEISLTKRQTDVVINSETEKAQKQYKNIAVSDKRNDVKIKSEKARIQTFQEDFKPSYTIPIKEEDIIKEDLANTSIAKEEAHDQISEKPIIIAEKKKASYIKADELLLGREIDKTREENHGGQKKMGVVDMEKIKIKGPNSLKIFGMTVFSDSSDTE